MLDHIGRVRTQKPPKKSYFVDAASVSQNLEVFNWTITNATLMKLTTIMYLHQSVNRKGLKVKYSLFFDLI